MANAVSSQWGANAVRHTLLDSPWKRTAVIATTFIASYYLPRLLDPQGGESKRSLLKRFFTITLPDNAPLVAVVFFSRIEDLNAVLSHPTALVLSFLAIGAFSKGLEWGRLGVAYISEKMPYIPNQVTKYLAPRDFYAS